MHGIWSRFLRDLRSLLRKLPTIFSFMSHLAAIELIIGPDIKSGADHPICLFVAMSVFSRPSPFVSKHTFSQVLPWQVSLLSAVSSSSTPLLRLAFF